MTQKFWKHMLPRPSITQSALTPTAGLCTSQEESLLSVSKNLNIYHSRIISHTNFITQFFIH